MSLETKKGLMWKAPVDFEIGVGEEAVKIKIHGFIPLPAAISVMPAYSKGTGKSEFNPEKLTADMLYYFLKQCVIEPVMDDEYLKNSDSIALMQIFKKINELVGGSKQQLKEIKKTTPTKQ